MPSRPRGYGGRTGRVVSRRFPVHAAFPASCKPSRGGAYDMLSPVNCRGLIEVHCRRFPKKGPGANLCTSTGYSGGPSPRAPVRTPHPCPRASGHPALLHPTFRTGDADADTQPRTPHAADPFPPGGGAPAAPRRAADPPSGHGPSTPTARACRPPKTNFRCGTALATFSGNIPAIGVRNPFPRRPGSMRKAVVRQGPGSVSAEQVEGSATPAQTGRAETLAGAFHPNARPLPAGNSAGGIRPTPSTRERSPGRRPAPLSFPPADAGHRSGIAAGHAAHLNRHSARDSSAADHPDVHGPPTHRVR